jgi:hypothetical protein
MPKQSKEEKAATEVDLAEPAEFDIRVNLDSDEYFDAIWGVVKKGKRPIEIIAAMLESAFRGKPVGKIAPVSSSKFSVKSNQPVHFQTSAGIKFEVDVRHSNGRKIKPAK